MALIGELRDSLDSAVAAPITPALGAELDRREAEADTDPHSGDTRRMYRLIMSQGFHGEQLHW